ncbi:discoidin domain-containing protein [Micromonospora sp. NPDC023814]|uniref:discoidin domain-containing protein n=1 Tax=Micromonospora sp. NPDC023814 TaxID=3154596 RepID=UPI0033D95149
MNVAAPAVVLTAMTGEHLPEAATDHASAHDSRPRATTAPGWLTDTGAFRRIGSALHWVGDRVAVVGGDPAAAEIAAELPAEPDAVTVVAPLDTADDVAVVEAVLPIAVPPGSRARVAMPGMGSAGRELAGRLARELTATVETPDGDLVLVPGGSLFAADGWLRHTPDGAATLAGRRSPRPRWEDDVDRLCADAHALAPGHRVLPLPAGIWLLPDPPGTPLPGLDDPAYSVPMDVARPVLLVGRPGHPEPPEEAIRAVVGGLPSGARRRLVLAPYGPGTTTAAAAAHLAGEAGHPVQVRTGLPVLAADGRPTSVAVDASGAAWEPLATALVFPPTGLPRPTGPVRGLDDYPAVESYVLRIGEGWVAEVTQSGLWVRPPGQETGAEQVRALPWTPGTVRIVVGAPGEPPGYHVLPLLGALLARMPAETRCRAHLTPDRFATARTGEELLQPDGTADRWAPAIRRAVVLRGPASAPTGPPGPRAEPPAAPRTPVVDDPTFEYASLEPEYRRPPSRLLPLPARAACAVLAAGAALGSILLPPASSSDGHTGPVLAVPPVRSSSAPSTSPAPTPEFGTPGPTGSTVPVSPLGTRLAPGSAPRTLQPETVGAREPAPAPVAVPPPAASPAAPPTASPAASPTMPGRVNDSGRNLAVAGAASASSVEPPGVFAVANANDGDPTTRWGSAFVADPQWLTIDLGDLCQVTRVRLLWEDAYATKYRVELSADAKTWQTVYRTSSGSGGTVDVAVTRTPARYVRMVATDRRMENYGYSLYELEVR